LSVAFHACLTSRPLVNSNVTGRQLSYLSRYGDGLGFCVCKSFRRRIISS
jgi:hypothetical protein